MEHHNCSLSLNGKAYDKHAKCYFDRFLRTINIFEGTLTTRRNLYKASLSGNNEFEILLDDGRKGNIVIIMVDPRDQNSGDFRVSGRLS